jgi:hypothetical protein
MPQSLRGANARHRLNGTPEQEQGTTIGHLKLLDFDDLNAGPPADAVREEGASAGCLRS